MEEIFEEQLEIFQEKNEDYGNSWEKIAPIKMIMASDEISIEKVEGDTHIIIDSEHRKTSGHTEEVVDNMVTRFLDKIIRIYNLTFNTEKQNVDESLEDSAGDLGNYALMLKKFLRGDNDA